MTKGYQADVLHDYQQSSALEWLETNGLGSFAGSTVSGTHTRKYHGMLVAALHPPVDRAVVVSRLEETIVIDGEVHNLSTNQFPGTVHPRGHEYLDHFQRDLFPEWIYKTETVTLRKTVAMVYGEQTTLVLYEVLDAPGKCTLELLPFYSCRDFHSLSHANDYIGRPYLFDKGVFQTMNYQGCPEFFIDVPKSSFHEHAQWYHNFEFLQEQQRDLEYREDLFTHGHFTVDIRKGSKVGVIISLDNPNGRDAFKLFQTEKKRREALVAAGGDTVVRTLLLAADQFVVKRGQLHSIIAGYPWFTDWGRDTMIALPGLCLSTGRYREARDILQAFAQHVSEGMIPNRFPDHNEVPEYNTIDATLWFFVALYRYHQHTGDAAFIRHLLPTLHDIVDWHYRGTRYQIHVDPLDDLLTGGAPGVQLTWMDAKVGDWVVTPRTGKTVEVNALWYNALCILAAFESDYGKHTEADLYRYRARRVLDNFRRTFWYEAGQYLYDYIDGETRHADLRPNQLYALSLPFPLLEGEEAQHILVAVESALLTPRGLRSLAPQHPDYKPFYTGGVWSRDGAYHQGTVWGYLMGAYIDALFYVHGETAADKAKALLHAMLAHLEEACVGSLSEIFDGDAPHLPKGCVAQAWTVGEVWRVAREYNLLPLVGPMPARRPSRVAG